VEWHTKDDVISEEVGMLARAREASDVHQRLNAVPGEQVQEPLQRVVRVPDGENGFKHGVPFWSPFCRDGS
jgi:hypothetical protein